MSGLLFSFTWMADAWRGKMAAARGQKELGSKTEFEHRFYGIAKESRCGLCCVHFISRKGKI